MPRIPTQDELLEALRRLEANPKRRRCRGRPLIANHYSHDEAGEYIPNACNDGTFYKPEKLRTLPADFAMAIAPELARRKGFKGDKLYEEAAKIYQTGTRRPVSTKRLRAIATTNYRELARGLLDLPCTRFRDLTQTKKPAVPHKLGLNQNDGDQAPALLRCHLAAGLASASNLAVETWG